MQHKAFTLIELLVVIAIIAILAAILFPVFAQANASAKRTAELSNVKNITLAMFLYTNDYDDAVPPIAQGFITDPVNQFTWKDSIYPYVKNGGRTNFGVDNSTPGNGGVFEAPTYSGNWGISNWYTETSPGDYTTRFPRAYALNYAAGSDEANYYGWNGSTNNEIWPDLRNWPWSSPSQNNGGNGTMTSLNGAATTEMIGATRDPEMSVTPQYLGNQCWSWASCDTTTGNESVYRSVGNKMITVGFFDGHAKSLNAYQALANDVFDWATASNVVSGGLVNQVVTSMHGIQEWN